MAVQNIIFKNLDLKNPEDLDEFLEIIKAFGFEVVHDPVRREVKVKGVFVYTDLPSRVLTLRNRGSEIVYTRNKDDSTVKFRVGLRNREIVYEIVMPNNIDVYYSDSSLLTLY
jgi:hypothetical protein